jgi:hypothetical protein
MILARMSNVERRPLVEAQCDNGCRVGSGSESSVNKMVRTHTRQYPGHRVTLVPISDEDIRSFYPATITQIKAESTEE